MKVRKIIFFLCLVLVPIILHAQKESKKYSYTLSGFYYPEYTFRIIDIHERGAESVLDIMRKREIGKFGFSTGILISNQRNKWFAFKTGACLSVMGYLTRPYFSYNYVYSENYKFRIINIPIKFSFNLFDYRSFTMAVDLGLHPGIALDYRSKIEYSNLNMQYSTSTTLMGVMRFRVLASAEVGLNYRVKRLILGISGAYKMNIIPMKDEYQSSLRTYHVTKFPYSIGGGLSIGCVL